MTSLPYGSRSRLEEIHHYAVEMLTQDDMPTESLLKKIPTSQKTVCAEQSERHAVRARKCVREDRVAEGVPAPRGKRFEVRGLGGNSPMYSMVFRGGNKEAFKYKMKYLKEINESMRVRASRQHRSR
jgi:hypothetical protein